MKVTADNYDGLKRFALWLFDRLNAGREIEPRSHPRLAMEALEGRSMAIARKGVAMMVGDLIEQTYDMNADGIASVDAALCAQGLPTLSEVKAQFSKKISAIMKRGKVRTDDEYYSLRNVVEAMPEAEQSWAWSLLGEFEQRGAG